MSEPLPEGQPGAGRASGRGVESTRVVSETGSAPPTPAEGVVGTHRAPSGRSTGTDSLQNAGPHA